MHPRPRRPHRSRSSASPATTRPRSPSTTRSTGLLHTGDTVYPGRIYVDDPAALLDTLDRLVTFADERDVSHVLGCHVEMTRTPGRDYPLGSRYQPDEPSPFMTVAQLRAARDAFRTVAHRPGIHRFDDVVFCVGEGPRRARPAPGPRPARASVRWHLGLLRRRPTGLLRPDCRAPTDA